MIISEKHKAAADHLLLDLADGTCGCGECRDIVARALAKAERDGMKRAAEIARRSGRFFDGIEAYRQKVDAEKIVSAILSEAGEE